MEALIAIGCTFLGAGMATTWWRNVHLERIEWWIAHCDKCEQQFRKHLRNLSRIAESAIATNDTYREFLRDKIIIDMSATKRREPPQA